MNASSKSARLRHLSSHRNADGGWGHYPGKASWLEPTVYSLFALGTEAKGLDALKSWQRPDGAFRPAAAIDETHWSTSLALLALQAGGERGPAAAAALQWMLSVEGNEGGWLRSVVRAIRGAEADQDEELHGWPWRTGNSSWIEPSSYALMAAKRAGLGGHARVRMAEAMILDRRCTDGGWNYGNKRVYRVTMPSYGETTAIALLGLQGHAEAGRSVGRALEHWKSQPVGLARAWLAIALRVYGAVGAAEVAERLGDQVPAGGDITLTALEAMALAPEAAGRAFGVPGAKGTKS